MSEPSIVLVTAGGDVAIVEAGSGPLIVVDPVGIAGPPGPSGATGPAGPSGANTNAAYAHAQIGPSAVWTVVHGLGYRPNVTVVDSGGTVVEGTVGYVSASELTITFSAAFSGTAYLS